MGVGHYTGGCAAFSIYSCCKNRCVAFWVVCCVDGIVQAKGMRGNLDVLPAAEPASSAPWLCLLLADGCVYNTCTQMSSEGARAPSTGVHHAVPPIL